MSPSISLLIVVNLAGSKPSCFGSPRSSGFANATQAAKRMGRTTKFLKLIMTITSCLFRSLVKFQDGVHKWASLHLGQHLNTIYFTSCTSVLAFYWQLEELPGSIIAEEQAALRKLVPGPSNWIRPKGATPLPAAVAHPPTPLHYMPSAKGCFLSVQPHSHRCLSRPPPTAPTWPHHPTGRAW